MVKSVRVKINRVLTVMLVLAVMLFAVMAVGCTDNSGDGGEGDSTCSHSFKRVEDSSNREPSYDLEGRELKKCSLCGVTAYFVIPKLQRTAGTEAPEYIPLLDSYVVSYGDTLERVASLYFTSGWAFVLEGETAVGSVSEEGYDFQVIFTPSDDKYAVVEDSIKLIVRKRVLTERDIYLNAPLNIPSSALSLSEIAISLSEEQVIKGTVSWAEGQEILRNQSAYYTYIFTPEDTENYAVYEGKILLNA